MSFMRDVAEAIAKFGEASTDDLVLVFPTKTRQQLRDGVKNAKFAGLIATVRHRGLGRAKGRMPSIYRACPQKMERPAWVSDPEKILALARKSVPNSVFAMGAM